MSSPLPPESCCCRASCSPRPPSQASSGTRPPPFSRASASRPPVPALIEKTRTVVSDGTGQYRITDLPPGSYVLTFTLTGFTTVRREGLVVSGSGVITVERRPARGGGAETVTVSAASPVVDTQSVRREVVLNNETLSTLPATRGYGSALATVPALNIGGVAGAGAATAPTTPNMMFFTAHGGASGEGRIMTNGMAVAAPVRRRRRVGRDLRHRQLGRDAGADFGRPRRSRNRRAEHQHRAQVGRQPVPRHRRSRASRAIGRRRTTSTTRMQGYGITQPPALRTNWDVSGSVGGPLQHDRLWFFANVRAWANAQVVDGIFANRFAGDASHWDYAANQSIEARIAESRKIYAGRLTAQLTPRNRITFSHDYQRRCGGSSLTEGGDGCRQVGDDWIGSGRTFGADTVSPESFPGYHDFPYNTTQATYSAPISNRVLLEAGFSRFAYGYARFGMAAPDGLMDLIPVTEQSGIYGRPQPLLSRRVRSARLRLQRQRRAAERLARVDVLRDRRAQREGRLPGLLLGGAQRARAEQSRSCATRSTTRSRSASRTSCRRAGISTIARRRSACTRRTNGRSGA